MIAEMTRADTRSTANVMKGLPALRHRHQRLWRLLMLSLRVRCLSLVAEGVRAAGDRNG